MTRETRMFSTAVVTILITMAAITNMAESKFSCDYGITWGVWNKPPPLYFQKWNQCRRRGNDFWAGDIFTFDYFEPGRDTVYKVDEHSFNYCQTNRNSILLEPGVGYTLSDVGENYFIDTYEDKCRHGVRMRFKVKPHP